MIVHVRASSDDEFARLLGGLEKQAFEDEVCAFLRRSIPDFQNVPAKPHGDGGLDGLSHGQTIAYCCYGPEQEPSKLKGKGLKDDIVTKFRSDIQTLFEVYSAGKGAKRTISHKDTTALSTIIAKGNRIKWVKLVVSVFNSHEIIGPLNTSFAEYRAASQCRYVDQTASLVVMGPKELASLGAVDDLSIMRVEQRALLTKMNAAVASSPPAPADTQDLDAKFDWLLANNQLPPAKTNQLRAHFKKRWAEAIAIENELANNALTLHQALTQAREDAVTDANLATATGPQELIQNMRARLGVRIAERFGNGSLGDMNGRMADGELARLIGECPVDWRK